MKTAATAIQVKTGSSIAQEKHSATTGGTQPSRGGAQRLPPPRVHLLDGGLPTAGATCAAVRPRRILSCRIGHLCLLRGRRAARGGQPGGQEARKPAGKPSTLHGRRSPSNQSALLRLQSGGSVSGCPHTKNKLAATNCHHSTCWLHRMKATAASLPTQTLSLLLAPAPTHRAGRILHPRGTAEVILRAATPHISLQCGPTIQSCPELFCVQGGAAGAGSWGSRTHALGISRCIFGHSC